MLESGIVWGSWLADWLAFEVLQGFWKFLNDGFLKFKKLEKRSPCFTHFVLSSFWEFLGKRLFSSSLDWIVFLSYHLECREPQLFQTQSPTSFHNMCVVVLVHIIVIFRYFDISNNSIPMPPASFSIFIFPVAAFFQSLKQFVEQTQANLFVRTNVWQMRKWTQMLEPGVVWGSWLAGWLAG